jgi:hypothetical protein
VISFAPFHLEGAKSFWERTAKWKALEAGEVFEVFRRAESLGDSRTLGDDSRRRLFLRWLGYRANLPALYAPELRASHLLRRRHSNLRSMDELEAEAGHFFFGRRETSSELASEVGRTAFEPAPLLDAYLRDTFALAEEHRIGVVFAAMPLNRTSFEGLRPAFLADHLAYVSDLARAHPGVRFAAKPWALPDDHFGDSSHVNRRGPRWSANASPRCWPKSHRRRASPCRRLGRATPAAAGPRRSAGDSRRRECPRQRGERGRLRDRRTRLRWEGFRPEACRPDPPTSRPYRNEPP